MPNPSEPRCRVCTHPDRAAIEQAVLNGRAQREVARMFGLGSGEQGTDAFRPDHKIVARHITNHMAALFQQTRTETLEEQGNALHRRMEELDAAVNEALARARAGVPVTDENGAMLDADGRPVMRYEDRLILAAVREARRNVDMRARLAGIVPEGEADAVALARQALESAEARKAVADLERMLSETAARQRPPA